MGYPLKLSPAGPLNRNDWFMLCKLQHTKCFLLWSRHFLFVMSRTEREREKGSWIVHAIRTSLPVVSFHVWNILLRAIPKPLWPLETAPIILVHTVLDGAGWFIKFLCSPFTCGACSSVVGWGTVLQARRSSRWGEFFFPIYFILAATLWPWRWLSL
jgi:hypothetical protein